MLFSKTENLYCLNAKGSTNRNSSIIFISDESDGAFNTRFLFFPQNLYQSVEPKSILNWIRTLIDVGLSFHKQATSIIQLASYFLASQTDEKIFMKCKFERINQVKHKRDTEITDFNFKVFSIGRQLLFKENSKKWSMWIFQFQLNKLDDFPLWMNRLKLQYIATKTEYNTFCHSSRWNI